MHIHDSYVFAYATQIPGWMLLITCAAFALLMAIVPLVIWFATGRRRTTLLVPPPSITALAYPSIDVAPTLVEPLTYRTAEDDRRRPGILMAISIISIVVATFGLVIGPLGTLSTVMQVYASRFMSASGPPTYGSTSVTIWGAGGATGSPVPSATINENLSRMSAVHRQLVVAEFNKLSPLPTARQEMLERLLADVGDDLFPFDQSAFTPERIASNISDAGKLPVTVGQPEGSLFYVLSNGRIEVGDNDATFTPAKRGEQAARIYRQPPATAPIGASTPAAMPAISIPRYSTGAIVLSILSGISNTIAAAYLMAIGIMMVRDARRSRMLHLLYVPLKFSLVLLASWAGWCWSRDEQVIFASIAGAAITPSMFLFKTLFLQIPGLIYPLALLVVMNVTVVRDYYRTWDANKRFK